MNISLATFTPQPQVLKIVSEYVPAAEAVPASSSETGDGKSIYMASLMKLRYRALRESVFRMHISSMAIVAVQRTVLMHSRMHPHAQPVRENANGRPRIPAPITLLQ